MKTIKVTEMNATDRGRKVRIFVSDMVRNTACDDNRPHWGWWYCVKGGEVAYFTTHRPTSGCSINNINGDYSAVEQGERDIFTLCDSRIDTAQYFAELLANHCE